MAEFNFLTYTIRIDKQTRAVQGVKQELKGVEEQTKKIGTAATKTGSAFSGLGGIVKGIGIAAVLATVTRQAFKGSDALQQLGAELLTMVSTITKALEPAFVVLARAVKGTSEAVTGLVKIVVGPLMGALGAVAKLMRGDIKGAFNELSKAIDEGFTIALNSAVDSLEGFAGQSQILLKATVDNMLSELQRDLKNTRLTGQQKLDLLNSNEEKLLTLLRKTTEFRQADRDTQTALEENFLRVFATEREAAEREQLTQATKNAQGRLKLAQVQAKIALDDEKATTEEKLEALTKAFELENEVIDANAEQKLESEDAVDALRLEAKLTFQEAIAAVNAAEAESEEMKAAKIKASQDAEFKRTVAFAKARIASSANAAAAEFLIGKNAGNAARAAGAQAIKDAANAAARIITIKGAEATARAFARGGGFPTGIPFAVATAAAYTVLAATVSAAGGVAAKAIAPPSGGGAGAAPVAPEGALGGPAPVEAVTVGGVERIGGGPTAAEVTAAPAGVVAGGVGGLTIGTLIIENVSDVRYIDILIDGINQRVLFGGQRLVATETLGDV